MTGLPRTWVRAPIGMLCDLKNGMAFKPTDWSRTGLPIVRIQNLNNPDAAYNHFEGEIRERFIIEKGNLLFAWSGTPGTSFGAHIWRGERAVLNQHIFRVDFDEASLCKGFFRLAINQKLNELIDKAHGGAGLQHVTKGRFEETLIEIPPLSEQHRIVAKIEELFSELDAGTASLTRARAQLKTYRQALLKAAFEGRLTAPWRAANPDKLESPETLLSRIRKERDASYAAALDGWQTALSEWRAGGEVGRKPGKPSFPRDFRDDLNDIEIVLTELPLGWAWGRLGFATCGVEYGTSAKSSNDGDVPVIRMGNLQNGAIDWSDLAFTSDLEEIEKYALDANDVLFNRTNSPELVGKTAIYRGDRPALFAGYLIRINQIDSTVLPEFLCYFLNSHTARKHGDTVKTDGVNQSNINGNKLQEYPFPFCSLEEQMEIVANLDAKLSSVDAIESEIATALTRITALRQSILKKAFSGQLVPQNPADEPASALLARLAQAPAPKPRRKTKP